MIGVFVGLVFGFCAGFSPDDANQPLELGYMSEGECVGVIEMPGSNTDDTEHVIGGHNIAWEQLDGGAEVSIDGQKFVIMRFATA